MRNKKEIIKIAAGTISVEQVSPDEVEITLSAAKERLGNVRLRLSNSDTLDYVDLVWTDNYNPNIASNGEK